MNPLELVLTRRSLARFAKAVYPSYEVDGVHKIILSHLEKLLSGEIRRLAITAPPRHGKTFACSVLFPAYALGRNPRETIITASYGAELSEGWGRQVKNIIGGPEFRKIFPNCQLSADSTAAWHFETTAGGQYSAIGRGGAATGRGASLLVLDDLLKDWSEANSETICKGVIDWLQSVAFTRLTPDGRVLAIQTRWSEKDPMGWIMQQAGWAVLQLPAFAEKNDPLGRQPGEALWPSMYPVEKLQEIKVDIGSRAFECLYQGNVAARSGSIFRREWFQHYTQRPEKFSRIIQSWDTGFKVGATNDYSVCATIGETTNGFYLLHLYRHKCEFPELKRQVAEQADHWRPHEILIEDRASGQSLIQEIKLATNYPIIPIKVDRDKETRASAVTGYFEAGRVYFPEGAPWLADLEDELASFPGGLHDDCVDSISQALNRMRAGSGAFGVIEMGRKLLGGILRMPERSVIVRVPASKKQAKLITTPSSSCAKCGSARVEKYGSVSSAKIRCLVCGAFSDPVEQHPCPNCGGPTNVVGGGGRRCIADGFQFWPDGGPPPVTYATRSGIRRVS
jgi:predicted phage terminase large subunit-like protein